MAKKRANPRTARLNHEHHFYNAGCQYIYGIDEAGRGPWAGPVSAAAVCLPVERDDLSKVLAGVRDSKDMTALQRERLSETIKEVALAWGIGSASASEIDELGIIPATKLAMQRALDSAISNFDIHPDCLFLDYMLWPERRDIPQISLVSGDKYSLSIASASVLAKVWRDEVMVELDKQFPEYGFASHKGYGTARHMDALKEHGPCEVHRKYYRPIQELMGDQESD